MDKNIVTCKQFNNPYYELYPEGDYWLNMKPISTKTALLIIDVQKHYVSLAEEIKNKFGNDYLYERLNRLVIPNSRKLLDHFREQKMPVIFATIGNQRDDGLDRSPTQTRPGWNYTLLKIGTPNQEVVNELKPLDNEIIVYKTTDSAVNGTHLGHMLRWMHIEYIVVTGILTDQCVSNTVRDLSDWGYIVFLVENATSALNADIQNWEIKILNQIYCKVVSTEEILNDLRLN